MISIIIPALNESATIGPLLKHLHDLREHAEQGYSQEQRKGMEKRKGREKRKGQENGSPEDLEIIVVDGSPTGDTVKNIKDPKIITLCSSSGRGVQMNTGANNAKGEILLFLHADTYLPPDGFRIITSTLSDSRISAGAFSLGAFATDLSPSKSNNPPNLKSASSASPHTPLPPPSSSTSVSTGSTTSCHSSPLPLESSESTKKLNRPTVYHKINHLNISLRIIAKLTTLRSRITRIPYGDQALFIRRSVFDEMGGFREIPIMEDLDLMRRMRKNGHRIRIVKEKVLTSSRRWEKEGIMRCTLRNWYLRFRFLTGTSAEALVKRYPPHGNVIDQNMENVDSGK